MAKQLPPPEGPGGRYTIPQLEIIRKDPELLQQYYQFVLNRQWEEADQAKEDAKPPSTLETIGATLLPTAATVGGIYGVNAALGSGASAAATGAGASGVGAAGSTAANLANTGSAALPAYDLASEVPSMFPGAAAGDTAALGGSTLATAAPYLGLAGAGLGAYGLGQQLTSDGSRTGIGGQALQGGLAGAGIGGGLAMAAPLLGLGPIGWAAAAGLGLLGGGLLGAGHGLFSSSKGKDQQYRDALRADMIDRKIIDDNYNLNFSDGFKYDIGQDGGARLQNAGANIDGRNDRSAFEVDFSAPGAGEIVGKVNPLVAILTGGNLGDINMLGYFANAIQAAPGADKNMYARELYAKYGIDHDTAYSEIGRLQQEGKISAADADAFRNGLDETFGVGAYKNKNTLASVAPSAFQTPATATPEIPTPTPPSASGSSGMMRKSGVASPAAPGGTSSGAVDRLGNGITPETKKPADIGTGLGNLAAILGKPSNGGFDLMEFNSRDRRNQAAAGNNIAQILASWQKVPTLGNRKNPRLPE